LEAYIQEWLISAQYGGKLSALLLSFHSHRKSTQLPMKRRLGGLQSLSSHFGEQVEILPLHDSWVLQSVA